MEDTGLVILFLQLRGYNAVLNSMEDIGLVIRSLRLGKDVALSSMADTVMDILFPMLGVRNVALNRNNMADTVMDILCPRIGVSDRRSTVVSGFTVQCRVEP